jgi:hypothetical protein
MSEPVTNLEIEDVLSSIRRLVSDEARSADRRDEEIAFKSDVPPQPVELIEEDSDVLAESEPRPLVSPVPALVLTAALRIEDDEDKRVADRDSDDHADENNATGEQALILTVDEAVHVDEADQTPSQSENEEAEVGQETHQLDDSQDSEMDHANDEITFENSDENSDENNSENSDDDHDDARDESHDEAAQTATAQSPDFNDEAPQSEEPRSIEDKIAALEALISNSETDFEPDGTEIGGNAGRPGQSVPWEDSHEPRPNLQSDVLPDPDSASQSAHFRDDASAFHQAHADAVGSVQAEIEANANETLHETEDLGTVLDEEALRDMVSEIVRQELQGPLGERITRNVRKLVRREIYRALAANELD